MSILTMNLRHLYQRRGLWLAYAMFGLFVWVSIAVALDDPAAGGGEGAFIGLIVLAFLIGMAAAVLQMEILTKPMAFCLPGHRQTVRRFVFSIGVATNAAGSLLFLFYPGLPFVWRLLVLGSACSAGLIFFLAGVWWVFWAKQPMTLVGFLIAIFFFGQQFGLHILLERAVVLHPLAVIGLGVLCAAAMWFYLNDAVLARRSCVRPWVGFDELFNREKLRRSQQARDAAPWARLKDHPRPWVENFFIGRMTRCRPLSPARFAWGAVYSSFAVVISQWTNVLFLVAVMAVFLGYFGSSLFVILLASLPVIAGAMHMSHGVLYSSLLTAGGRAERFYSTLAVAAAATGLLMLFMGTVVGLSVPLAAILPEFRVYGHTLTYGVISARIFYGPLVLLPIAATIHLVFYRRPVLTMIVLMALVYAVVMGSNMWRHELRSLANASTATLLVLLCWLAFGAVAHALATRRCLVR